MIGGVILEGGQRPINDWVAAIVLFVVRPSSQVHREWLHGRLIPVGLVQKSVLELLVCW